MVWFKDEQRKISKNVVIDLDIYIWLKASKINTSQLVNNFLREVMEERTKKEKPTKETIEQLEKRLQKLKEKNIT